MPTGSGKSLLWQLMSLIDCETNAVNVLVVPTKALSDQVVYQCKEKRIPYVIYDGSKRYATSDVNGLLILAVEHCGHDACLQLLRDLQTKERLARVFVDEAQCLISWSSWRQEMLQVVLLNELKVPIVYLTGTFPPDMKLKFMAQVNAHAHVLRAPSMSRDNLKLSVITASSRDINIEICKALVGKKFNRDTYNADLTTERAIVYTFTITDCQQLQQYLNDHGVNAVIYHSRLDSDQRNDNYSQWKQGEAPVMVATSAFGMGIDYPNVSCVIAQYGSYSLLDLYQAFGRAGRNGKLADCIVVTCNNALDVLKNKRVIGNNHTNGELVMIEMVNEYNNNNNCRRKAMMKYLEGRDDVDTCISMLSTYVALCDNCESVYKRPQLFFDGSNVNQLRRSSLEYVEPSHIDFDENEVEVEVEEKKLQRPIAPGKYL